MGESITAANALSNIVSAAGCISSTLSPCKEFVTGSKAIEISAQVPGVRLRSFVNWRTDFGMEERRNHG
jgi:hypothetical protein